LLDIYHIYIYILEKKKQKQKGKEIGGGCPLGEGVSRPEMAGLTCSFHFFFLFSFFF
jgi:hypothetical protein